MKKKSTKKKFIRYKGFPSNRWACDSPHCTFTSGDYYKYLEHWAVSHK